jgi:hypothetical protein
MLASHVLANPHRLAKDVVKILWPSAMQTIVMVSA